MNLFYAHPEDIAVPVIKLKGQESKHASKVLRYRMGDEIVITDGEGNLYHCKISSIGQDDLTAEVQNSNFQHRPKPYVTLVLGLIKKRDRLEFAIEKCVELGADRIVVFKGDHSEKQNVREDRIFNTALSAMKQSLRVYLPEIKISNSLIKAFEDIPEIGTIICADETKNGHDTKPKSDKSFTLIIGPEGGFSVNERELIKKLEAVTYSLGEKRLRTETAAISMVDRFKSGRI